MTKMLSLLVLLGACAEAPTLIETEAPPEADLAIATAIDSIERYAPEPVVVPWPDPVMFLDQDTVLDSGGGFTNVNRLLGRECAIYIIDRDQWYDSVGHELVHCAIVATQCSPVPDTDQGHVRDAWWAIVADVQADVRAALAEGSP